ncbi:hypothetical protein AK812_SmicGene38232 [Symbiodinium microadriaticum]|uniref:Expansin-like EG45 domain-containing protein n=1 Tax=Symbiodinium microadriaticum TaxID=2951 RepID=A0A1Q9CEB0_SYMMI|nr:hypothetical protein AK812_SmicGene38232 [Symbiodinium microadriaticum]
MDYLKKVDIATGGHGDHGPVDKGCGSGNRTLTCCAGYTDLSPPELVFRSKLHWKDKVASGDKQEIYGNGAACGSCWKVAVEFEAHREGQGSMVVQIIGSHGGSDLGCFFDAFRTISGADSGTFEDPPQGKLGSTFDALEVSLEPVQCEVADAGPVATILDGNNAWYTRAIFSNLPYAVVKASILVDGKACGGGGAVLVLVLLVVGVGVGARILRRLLQFLACRDGKFLHRLKLPNSQPNTGTDYDEPDLCSSHSDNPEGHHPSSDRNHAAILSLRGPW